MTVPIGNDHPHSLDPPESLVKLLRVGPAGAERPALLDQDGVLRDLSALTPDIDGTLLADPDALD
ncbi:hypothetical protein ACWCOY_36885, partial [Streptomyces tubercidicus]